MTGSMTFTVPMLGPGDVAAHDLGEDLTVLIECWEAFRVATSGWGRGTADRRLRQVCPGPRCRGFIRPILAAPEDRGEVIDWCSGGSAPSGQHEMTPSQSAS